MSRAVIDLHRIEERACRAYILLGICTVLAIKVGPLATWRLIRKGPRS